MMSGDHGAEGGRAEAHDSVRTLIARAHWVGLVNTSLGIALLLGLLQVPPLADWPLTIATYSAAAGIPINAAFVIASRFLLDAPEKELRRHGQSIHERNAVILAVPGSAATLTGVAALLWHFHFGAALAFVVLSVLAAWCVNLGASKFERQRKRSAS
jgi:cytochrome c biogenesis protein CcdA